MIKEKWTYLQDTVLAFALICAWISAIPDAPYWLRVLAGSFVLMFLVSIAIKGILSKCCK